MGRTSFRMGTPLLKPLIISHTGIFSNHRIDRVSYETKSHDFMDINPVALLSFKYVQFTSLSLQTVPRSLLLCLHINPKNPALLLRMVLNHMYLLKPRDPLLRWMIL